MSQADRYFIGPGLRDKLRDVIRRVDGGVYGGGGTGIPTRLQEMNRGGGADLRLGRVTGSWLKGATKTVVQLDGNGIALSPEKTFEAKNFFSDISIDCGTKKVACARIGGAWILIAAEC